MSDHVVHRLLGIATRNGNGVRVLAQELEDDLGIVDDAAGKGLHHQDTHTELPRQRERARADAVRFDEVEGELDGAEEFGPDKFDGHLQAVGGDADVADLARQLRLDNGLQGAARGGHRLPVLFMGDLVQLVKVDVVGAEHAEAVLQLFRGRCRIRRIVLVAITTLSRIP